jgi:hypothetical protein
MNFDGHEHDRRSLDLTTVPCVRLKLRAGIAGFETEPDLTHRSPLVVPTLLLHELNAAPHQLLGLQIKDHGMEPLLFEDDWVVVNTADTRLRSGDIYAVNWDGEACIQQLVQRGGQWYLTGTNPLSKSINVRSGQPQIVGRAVYQPGRLITGRLAP